MTTLPVIARELRAEARHGFTYGLRVLGAAALLLVAAFFALDRGLSPNAGGELFRRLHLTLFLGIWILVPLAAADCISRERREGTLGLLFLTPLRAWDIVIAKQFVQGLRAFTLILAVLPVVVVPLLVGGVSGQEALMSILANLGAFAWALGAGVLASSRSKTWLRAQVSAGAIAFVFFVVYCVLLGSLLYETVWSMPPGFARTSPWRDFNVERLFLALASRGVFGLQMATGLWGMRIELFRVLPKSAQLDTLWITGIATTFSFLALGGLTLLAAGNISRRWQEEPPSARQLWWEKVFCTPVLWKSQLRRWMKRRLERNPIGWLEQRTWSGRLVTWSWLAVVISVESLALSDLHLFLRTFDSVHHALAWLLIGSIAATAAGSFRRERENGVLELLLVAPLTVGQLIGGRLRGLWAQFLPTMALLLWVWVYLTTSLGEAVDWKLVGFYASSFLSAPVIGLYFSLRKSSYITALLWSFFAGVLLPFAAPGLAIWTLALATDGRFGFYLAAVPAAQFCFDVLSPLLQILLAVWLGRRLHVNLTRRSFALEKARG